MSDYVWRTPSLIEPTSLDKFSFSPKLKEIIFRRGFVNEKLLSDFLNPLEPPPPLNHFPYLEKATKRIIHAIHNKEKIAICGDYDADGMTSTALITDVLQRLKADVSPIIPSRNEDGYGINKDIINNINSSNIKLVITVDNGVSALEAINYAYKLKIDLIITDHHKIHQDLTNVYALIHPETTPKNSPYRVLAGVGITYILAENVASKLNNTEALGISKDLLCIGTIADMASLTGVNRFWLKKWIKEIHKTRCLGLRGILKNAKLTNKEITEQDISFKIAPRINSIGRIDDPKLIINLLLEKDLEQVNTTVEKCEQINKRRRLICKYVEEEALQILDKENTHQNSFIIVTNQKWNHGVIGIVASRIMEIYKKPTAVLSKEADGLYRGSARSPKGFDLSDALKECSTLLEKFGGHKAAAGFTVREENIKDLNNKLNTIALESSRKKHSDYELFPEAHLFFEEITDKLINELKDLEPFGINNERPLFWTRKCTVIEYKIGYFGQICFKLKQGEHIFNATKWNNASIKIPIPKYIDVAYHIETQHSNIKSKTTLNIKDYRISNDKILIRVNNREYKCYKQSNEILVIENDKKEKIIFNVLANSLFAFENSNMHEYKKGLIKACMSALAMDFKNEY